MPVCQTSLERDVRAGSLAAPLIGTCMYVNNGSGGNGGVVIIRAIGKRLRERSFSHLRAGRVLSAAAASHRLAFLISDDRRAAKVTTSIFSFLARTHISAETPDSIAFVHLYPSICHARDNGAAGPDSLFGGLAACLEPRVSSSRG